MTFEEFLNKPNGMTFEEWEQELQKRKTTEKKIRFLSEKIQECEDALDVLQDETGSARWKKWSDKLEKCKKQMTKLTNQK